jgi:hypothetical protein
MAGALAVVHDIPGRLRIRLPAAARCEGLEETIRKRSGVVSCGWTPQTRSVLIQYRAGAISARELAAAVATHCGVGNGWSADIEAQTTGPPMVSVALTRVFADMNQSVSRLTGGAADLRTLVPLGLVAWALREILSGRAGPLAWSAALWYAHGLFRDYALPDERR